MCKLRMRALTNELVSPTCQFLTLIDTKKVTCLATLLFHDVLSWFYPLFSFLKSIFNYLVWG
jgi:hypothetical protein